MLAAAIDGLDLGERRAPGAGAPAHAVQERSHDVQRASCRACAPADLDRVGVDSSFFEVRGRLRLDDRVLEERSLVQRADGSTIVVLQRERIAGVDGSGLR